MYGLEEILKRKKESRAEISDLFENVAGTERRKKFLRYINRGWLIFGLVTLFAIPIFPEQRLEFIYLMLVVFPTYLITRRLNSSERSQLAGLIFTVLVDVCFYGLFLVLVRELGAEKAFDTQISVWMLMGLSVLFAGAFVDKWAAPIFALINTILLISTRLILAPHTDPRPSALVFWWMLAFTIWLYESTLTQAFTRVLDELTKRKQIETALDASEAQYKSLVEKIPGAVTLHLATQPRHYVYVSPAIEELLGYTPDEWMKQQVTGKDILHPLDAERVLAEDVRTDESGDPFKVEYRIRRKDGRYIWVSEQASLITNEAGKPLYWQCLYLDINERKEAEHELISNMSRLRLATQLAHLGIWDWEIASDKTSWYGEMFNIYGVAPDKFTGKGSDYIASTRADYRQKQANNITDAFRHGITEDQMQHDNIVPFNPKELCIVRPDHTEVYTLGDAIAIVDEHGQPIRMLGVTMDITDRKQAEHEREKLIAELTAKNAELERFTYTVSHDLKSPLVTIRGFMGYLEQDALAGNIERLKMDMLRISGAVEKMQALLNDLLELSRIGRFVNLPQLIPFERLAQEAIELTQTRIQERGITVEILSQSGLPVVYGDKQRLVEVLENLLDNAAKYMGSQLKPSIEIGQRGQDENKPVFFVRDNGIGIAPEYHERVFGLFNKLDARSEGTGIGLTLVKRILEFHGCRIWVESEIGKGSTFLFTLPSQPKPDSVI